MSPFHGQVVGVAVMINKRNGCDGSASVFTNMDEKVREGAVITGEQILELFSIVYCLVCIVSMSVTLMQNIY